MIRPSTAFAVLACACSATSTAIASSGTDDSAWINSGITAALQNGLKEYDLPAGTYVLQNPILIPAGTSNFTLKGAGSGLTILTTPVVALSALVQVGSVLVLHNDWGLTNLTNYAVNAVNSGSSVINVPPGTNIVVGHYYVLWDSHMEWANNSNVTDVMNHAEITKVTKYNSSSGTVTLDQPTSRSYDSTAQLADANANMCTNINVSGFGMNGTVVGTTNASSSLLLVGLVDKFTTNDMYVTTYLTGALDFVNTRNLTITNASVNNAIATGPGQGYGVTLQRCRFVTVKNCTATNGRHGIICHAGTTDATISSCTCKNCSCDMHGMDERRITWSYDYCDGTIQVGNQSWPEGDQAVTITGGEYDGGLNLCAYANSVSASGTKFGPLNLWSDLAGVTNPAWNQYADKISVSNCSFVGPHDLIQECPQLGTMTLTNCTFESTQTSWGNTISIKSLNAKSLTFSGCTIMNDCTNVGYDPVVISTPATGCAIYMKNSTLTDAGGSNYGMQLKSTFVGTGSFTSNTFISDGGNPTAFLLNQSSSKNITDYNNSAKAG